jgi:hypothetical protein
MDPDFGDDLVPFEDLLDLNSFLSWQARIPPAWERIMQFAAAAANADAWWLEDDDDKSTIIFLDPYHFDDEQDLTGFQVGESSPFSW